jgi:hypothetical protein
MASDKAVSQASSGKVSERVRAANSADAAKGRRKHGPENNFETASISV